MNQIIMMTGDTNQFQKTKIIVKRAPNLLLKNFSANY